jgi:hypothetical protein
VGEAPARSMLGQAAGRGVAFLVSRRVSEIPAVVVNETVVCMAAILGYARVSATGQDLGAQLVALTAAVGVRRLFDERRPGSPGEAG